MAARAAATTGAERVAQMATWSPRTTPASRNAPARDEASRHSSA